MHAVYTRLQDIDLQPETPRSATALRSRSVFLLNLWGPSELEMLQVSADFNSSGVVRGGHIFGDTCRRRMSRTSETIVTADLAAVSMSWSVSDMVVPNPAASDSCEESKAN
jgi:hypothetical protein